ncbi:hypothetical protein OCU04_005545 [Sclerotinia nivalis]|uniref:Nucleotide-sugar transporter n=1 Tax=Sclerotinia nivalis TaxID=352851 RepID=A0A9X0APC6_9HELO|nr:hypothetical protein OCU04_005545 [Sclerotinia nivalis]
MSIVRQPAVAGLVLLILQNAASLILQHKLQSSSVDNDARYEPATVIILSEILKLAVSSICVGREVLHAPAPSTAPSFFSTIKNGHYKASVPAVLYTVAMASQAVGAYRLDIFLYLVLSQIKIIIAPIFATIFLKQAFRPQQWLCLILMTVGMVLAQVGSVSPAIKSSAGSLNSHNMVVGVMAMVLAGCCVALAGVYMEMVLKASRSMMVRNAQLAWYSCACGILGLLCWSKIDLRVFFHGYRELVWVLVMLQAIGGFLVSWCVRLTSTVAKNYAQSFGFLIALTIPIFDLSHAVNYQLSCGVVFICAAVFGSIHQAGVETRITDRQQECPC